MSVDYRGHFGIGYNVDYGEDRDAVVDILEMELDDLRFKWFDVGDSYNETPEIYVAIINPFENGIQGLGSKKANLETHLNDINIKTLGVFRDIGGLEVW